MFLLLHYNEQPCLVRIDNIEEAGKARDFEKVEKKQKSWLQLHGHQEESFYDETLEQILAALLNAGVTVINPPELKED